MKIAVVVNELNVRGGTHKQVLRLCQYLKKNNIDFILCTKIYDKNRTYREFQEFNIIALYYNSTEWEKSHHKEDNKRLYQCIPDDIDIINVHDNQLNGFMFRAILNHKKIVWQINDLPPVFQVGVDHSYKKTIKDIIGKKIIKYIAKRAKKITVNVTKNKERVEQAMGVDAEVFYCGVDVNDRLIQHSYSDLKSVFNLLSMGVFIPYRNYEMLIETVQLLKKSGYKLRLNIIGNTEFDPQYVEKIRNMIQKTKLESYIKIWGQVDDEVYTTLFNEANAFAFVNIEQSWGLAVFEAMSAGLPTIVSNSVGAIELLHNNQDAIIVNPKNSREICDAIIRLISDEQYYNSISRNAANAVKSFTWDDLYSSKMLAVFNEIMEEVK